MEEMVIGIIGGMGTYATVDFFRRLAEAFPGEKEWDRPRMIVDNYCTMPSRVRAILYNERWQELVDDLSDSVRNMLRAGANRLILVCNTSHVFLPDVVAAVPESANRFVHIIKALAEEISKSTVRELALIASEGTIDTNIYGDTFAPYGIRVHAPDENQFALLREFIEAVKQNAITDDIKKAFAAFIDSFSESAVILGCTELPILFRECVSAGYIPKKSIFDPLQSVINILVAEKSQRC